MRIGLSLSGGGFRATLFHLGVIRCLRDRGLLRHVKHICSVSGGSVMAAHLLQNWEQYNGNDEEFGDIATKLIDFIRRDIRCRILRRFLTLFPFFMIPHKWLVGRQITVTSFLQSYLAQLYSGEHLNKLRGFDRPTLHILATDLARGELCSFTNHGFSRDFMVGAEHQPPRFYTTGSIPISLAVAASSAYPALFPPIEITDKDIRTPGAFENQRGFLTDGGVYDNLGVRKFQQLIQHGLGNPEFTNEEIDLAIERGILNQISQGESLFIQHLRHRLNITHACPPPELRTKLNEQLHSNTLYRNQDWPKEVELPPEAHKLIDQGRDQAGAIHLDYYRQTRLNRLLLQTALPKSLTSHDGGFDAVLVSNAGGTFRRYTEIPWTQFLLGTSLRAADILTYRIRQLETASANKGRDESTNRFVFIDLEQPNEIRPVDHRFALAGDIQKLLPPIRTDLDRFSVEEVRALVRQGYCTADLTIEGWYEGITNAKPLISGPDKPWEPISSEPASISTVYSQEPSESLLNRLQKASVRRFGLFSFRSDWLSFVHLFSLAGLLILFVYWLLPPARKTIVVPAIEVVGSLTAPDYSGFTIAKAERIVDLRHWRPVLKDDESKKISPGFWTDHLYLCRLPGHSNQTIRIQFKVSEPEIEVRCPQFPYKVRKSKEKFNVGPRDLTHWEIEIDVSEKPEDVFFDLDIEAILWNSFQGEKGDWAGMVIDHREKQASLRVILPEHKKAKVERRFLYPKGQRGRGHSEGVIEYPQGQTELFWLVENPKSLYTYCLGSA